MSDVMKMSNLLWGEAVFVCRWVVLEFIHVVFVEM
jgi:hypothetical protein